MTKYKIQESDRQNTANSYKNSAKMIKLNDIKQLLNHIYQTVSQFKRFNDVQSQVVKHFEFYINVINL